MFELATHGTSHCSLTCEDLLRPFQEACKPCVRWRIGTESERFGVRRSTGTPIRYNGPGGIVGVFDALVTRFGWRKRSEIEGGPPIALVRDSAAITLEPGAQLELSGAPLATVHEIHREARQHLMELESLSEDIDIGWIAVGFHPVATPDQLGWVPKARYRVMRNYLPSRGSRSLDMMQRTATVQVNLDYSDETDAIRKLKVALKLSPIVSAMFANSPFVEGKLFGGRSYRQLVWLEVDPDRQGLLPQMWRRGASLHDYVGWALDAPMFLVQRGERVVANTEQSFRVFMREGFRGIQATLDDWQRHLNGLFPEARLRNTLELRGADSVPSDLMCALPALWTGLMYDSQSLSAVEEMCADWNHETMHHLRASAARAGLRAPFLAHDVAWFAERVVQLAHEGLRRRARIDPETGEDETAYLAPLAQLVEQGMTPADRLIQEYGSTDGSSMEIPKRLRA